jgi:hypothetical protein
VAYQYVYPAPGPGAVIYSPVKSHRTRHLVLAALFVVISVAGYVAYHRTGVVIGTKDEVYYSGSATKDEAQALGNALKTIGYFTDKGADVFLAKGTGGTIVSFVVEDGTWNDPAKVTDFAKIVRGEASTVGGLPITLRLLNTSDTVEKSEVLNQRTGVVIGTNDEVFYFGSATKDEAQALGNALKTIGYFTDKGAYVYVAKGKDGTIVSFVVTDGTWNDPTMVANFETIARGEASTVGGLPITLRLLNTSDAVEKSEVLN